MAVEARRHQEGHYVHIYRAREGPGETRGCRNGAVGTWKLLYNGDREEKRHKDKDPKPCRQNTACAAQQSRGRPHQAGDATPPPGARQEAQSPSHAPRAPVGDIAPPPGASNRYSLLLTPRGPAGGAISPRPQHSGPVRAAGSGVPFSAPLLLGAQGRQPSPTAPGREEEPTRREC